MPCEKKQKLEGGVSSCCKKNAAEEDRPCCASEKCCAGQDTAEEAQKKCCAGQGTAEEDRPCCAKEKCCAGQGTAEEDRPCCAKEQCCAGEENIPCCAQGDCCGDWIDEMDSDPAVIAMNMHTLSVLEAKTFPCLPAKFDVLEIGCGGGHLLAELEKKAVRVVGVDCEPQCLENAKTRSQAELILGWWPMVQVEGKFDLVLVTYALHGVAPDSRKAFVDGVLKVMNPGGVLVLADFDTVEGERYKEAFADALASAKSVEVEETNIGDIAGCEDCPSDDEEIELTEEEAKRLQEALDAEEDDEDLTKEELQQIEKAMESGHIMDGDEEDWDASKVFISILRM
ncbi:MAG: uncharacterized protein KVP18_000848 [Porospora cf. gigantea A]|uniref:uncharacterized protein n=1 Tax=Porospora cf. gigantea A TaxID=2853593 RepID=UPI00355A7285|nr:MAG: hypothetical protein KVP18_000848 [Porospora cf. gigantea A]